MSEPPDGAIPFGIAQMSVQVHAEFSRQDTLNVIENVGAVDQRIKKWEGVLSLGSSKPSASISVTFPRLWFNDNVVSPTGETSKKVFESRIAVIQVNLQCDVASPCFVRMIKKYHETKQMNEPRGLNVPTLLWRSRRRHQIGTCCER